jgi:PhzF family phenazine biosynthesis protein
VVEPLDDFPDADWMQALAAENNQAETAYLRRTDDPARFELRWFTPMLEVPLCGHATLAAAHALFAELGLAGEQVTFDTRSGPLTVTRAGDLYETNFPASPPVRIEPPAGLAEALGVAVEGVWAAQFLIAVVADEAAVRAAQPDVPAMMQISSAATQGRGNVAVVALADALASYEVVSRFFAPGSGIPEDAATGSMHCILSPLYSDKLGQAVVRFHQAYPGRGADLECEHRGERVLLRGNAVTVVESRLRL